MVFSVFGGQCSAGVSLLVRRSLNAIVSLVFAGDGGRLIVVNVVIKSFEFRVVAVFAPNSIAKIDEVGWSASGSSTCESSLNDLMAQHNLVGRLLMWLDSTPSVRIRTYLDRVLFRRADIESVRCSTFHWIGLIDHKLVRVSQWLVTRPSLAGYWKCNTSLLEIRDFWERLETLIQRALVGAVTENKWWDPLNLGLGTSPSNMANSSI